MGVLRCPCSAFISGGSKLGIDIRRIISTSDLLLLRWAEELSINQVRNEIKVQGTSKKGAQIFFHTTKIGRG